MPMGHTLSLLGYKKLVLMKGVKQQTLGCQIPDQKAPVCHLDGQ
jgi:hypothetical protein